MKNWKKAILLTIVCTLGSVLISHLVKLFGRIKLARSIRIKDILKELYPAYEWEHTGTYIHLCDVIYSVWYPEEFPYKEGETEEQLMNALVEKDPGFEQLNIKIKFMPLDEFEDFLTSQRCPSGKGFELKFVE